MFTFETQIRVRYGETDQMGYMYYGNYAEFYEVARTEMLRSTGISYKELETKGVMLPVHELRSIYHHPARYDELITIRTVVRDRPTVRLKFEYYLYNVDQVLINEGYTELIFVDIKKNRPCRAPAEFDTLISKYF